MATSSNKVDTPKPRKVRMLLVALAALSVTAAAGAAAYYLIGDRKGAAAGVAVPAEPVFIALEPLTVNLQSSGRSRFLHVGVTLKVADAKSQSQITQYLPEVRSRVLTLLSNRESDSLLTPNDKTQLAGEIMAALNQPFAPHLPQQKISGVMFSAFILQ